ncbi:LuxR C-terminal-related transcriptional regulator, partial [Croceibacter atlanticus]
IASVRLPGPFQQALRNGSAAFVPKSAGKETLVRAIEAVAGKRARVAAPLVSHLAVQRSDERGRLLAERLERLTPQQRRVLTLIRQGLSNKQIAHILAVGESTVKSHVTQLLR